LAAEKAI
jgi:hypothetical protein